MIPTAKREKRTGWTMIAGAAGLGITGGFGEAFKAVMQEKRRLDLGRDRLRMEVGQSFAALQKKLAALRRNRVRIGPSEVRPRPPMDDPGPTARTATQRGNGAASLPQGHDLAAFLRAFLEGGQG